MQEAWLRWHNLDRHALREPQAWLTTVARRLAIDHRRAAALHAERLALLNAGGNTLAPAADDEAAQNEAVRKALVHIIRRLSPAETALVLLHEVFDADHADIAAAWRRSEPACRQALRRALQRVRRRDGPADPRDTCTESALLSLCLGALSTSDWQPRTFSSTSLRCSGIAPVFVLRLSRRAASGIRLPESAERGMLLLLLRALALFADHFIRCQRHDSISRRPIGANTLDRRPLSGR